jgi:hypothetical protein
MLSFSEVSREPKESMSKNSSPSSFYKAGYLGTDVRANLLYCHD